MPPEVHALLGASSAKRWLSCPPSARLTESMPDTAGVAAEEGRVAHALGELKLRKFFFPMSLRTFNAALKKIQADKLYCPEMESATDEYKDAVNEISLTFSDKPYIALEQQVDFSDIVPDGFGTADFIAIGDDVLHIADYKHGKGIQVDAEDNPQMRLYALGALRRYDLAYPIKRVRMTIVQPRNGGVSHAEEMTVEELEAWATGYVKPRAQLAADGTGEYGVGDWCRFCKAKATCRARSDYNLSLEGFKRKMPPMITNDEIGDALRRALDLKSWLSDLEEYALSALLSGAEVAGWKAVEGRAVRAWTDQEAAFAAAKAAGIDEAVLYKRLPVTLAALEKDIGKKAFAPLTEYVTTPPGKPALAQSSDHRPAITARPTAEDDFSAQT
jgi:hypothetical protein